MTTRSEAIKLFLNNTDHNAHDLTSRYHEGMEVQVMVARGTGEPVDERENKFSDGVREWYQFRMPKKAGTSPEPNDYPIYFLLEDHASDIGMTGWDFKERCSRWVAYDIDAVVGHAPGTGISDEEMEKVRQALEALPYVELRRSTSGTGLHAYVYFGPDNLPETANHKEHAALARAVLSSRMSVDVGFNLSESIDVCGGVMWVWSRRATADNQGLARIKEAAEPLRHIPANWRDHLEVVRGKRSRVRGPGLPDAAQDAFADLTAAYPATPLDDTHRELAEWLANNGYASIWEADHNCLHTHTHGLAEAHKALGYQGVFKTLSPGTDPGMPNCFAFPNPNGAWAVYRFGQGTSEAPIWHQTAEGWVGCKFNVSADLATAAAAESGVEMPNGGFFFTTATAAMNCLRTLGGDCEVPDWIKDRETTLKPNQDKRRLDGFIAYVPDDDGKTAEMVALGWCVCGKPKRWVKVFHVDAPIRSFQNDLADMFTEYDDVVRSLVSVINEDAGWMIRHTIGEWVAHGKDNAKSVLRRLGMSSSKVDAFLGGAILDAWRLVNEPFQDEFPGGRLWNRDGAKLAFEPSDGDRPMAHPHWDKILAHCGWGLDQAVADDPWCRANDIYTGADYLRLWAAILFRHPKHPLPYLFFFSPDQNIGKSTYHQALGLLFEEGRGYQGGDAALTNQQGFNGELAGSVLCYVEETNLRRQGTRAYERMKHWLNTPSISIHPKGKTPYMTTNYTHWLQTANSRDYCPIFEEDTRVVFIDCQPFEGDEIPWEWKLSPLLEEEAPDFLRTLLDLKLPEPVSRFWLPVIETQARREAIEAASSEDETSTSRGTDYHALATAIFDLLVFMGRWRGTASELLRAVKDGPWPQHHASFGRALRKRELQDALAEMGVRIWFAAPGGPPNIDPTDEFGKHYPKGDLYEAVVGPTDLEYLFETLASANG